MSPDQSNHHAGLFPPAWPGGSESVRSRDRQIVELRSELRVQLRGRWYPRLPSLIRPWQSFYGVSVATVATVSASFHVRRRPAWTIDNERPLLISGPLLSGECKYRA